MHSSLQMKNFYKYILNGIVDLKGKVSVKIFILTIKSEDISLISFYQLMLGESIKFIVYEKMQCLTN